MSSRKTGEQYCELLSHHAAGCKNDLGDASNVCSQFFGTKEVAKWLAETTSKVNDWGQRNGYKKESSDGNRSDHRISYLPCYAMPDRSS